MDPSVRNKVIGLRARQLKIGREINQELDKMLLKFGDSRYRYTAIDSFVAIELLKYRFGITAPHAEQMLLAIKTARTGSIHTVNKSLKMRFTKDKFIVDSHL